METLYDVLGVDSDANPERIRQAYREQAKRHHPDRSEGNGEQFKRLTTARDVLLDDARRKRYDLLGHRRYAIRHLDSERWPASRSPARRRGRKKDAARSGNRRARRVHRTRTHRGRTPRRSGPVDGFVALETYWPVVVRAGIALVALLVLAFVLSALSL